MKRRNFVATAVLSVGLLLGVPNAWGQVPVATTVIVVRHAEKAAQPAADPALTTAGKERATALATALKDAGVSAVITTQYLRTRETAEATATEFGIKPEIVSAGKGSVSAHAQAVAAAVMRHAGGTVLVVGHSNTVPEVVAALGAKQPAPICDDEYDGMYIVTIAWGGHATVVHARYGEPAGGGKGCGGVMKE